MDRVAVFVDAGYLFAQGSATLFGSKQRRTELRLDAEAAVKMLKEYASSRAPSCALLRIYWYDGAVGGARPTSDQALLASLDDVKLRLGFVNNSGQQKGVDSLIVTDMIELARLGSICEAILMSGDEDVRVGVQIAQSYGVRVHLLGIAPSRASQSLQLLQEADTTREWSVDLIRDMLSLKVASSETSEGELSIDGAVSAADIDDVLKSVVIEIISRLDDADIRAVHIFWQAERGVPREYDVAILRNCRAALDRNLDSREMKFVRRLFREEVLKLI